MNKEGTFLICRASLLCATCLLIWKEQPGITKSTHTPITGVEDADALRVILGEVGPVWLLSSTASSGV